MDSVTLAKQHQQQERQRVEFATGIRFVGDTPVPPRAVLIRCPRCAFHAAARTEGRAVQSIVGHLLRVHFPQEQQ